MAKNLKQQIESVFPDSVNHEVVTVVPREVTRTVMNPRNAIKVWDHEQCIRVAKQATGGEASLSAACINLMAQLLIAHEAAMRLGPKADSTKGLVTGVEEEIFGPKEEILPGGSKLRRPPLPNTWQSTKATCLAFFRANGNPFIVNESGETVGLVSLASMREELSAGKQKKTKDQEERYEDAKAAAAYLNQEYSEMFLQFMQDRVKSLREGKDNAEGLTVVKLPALPN